MYKKDETNIMVINYGLELKWMKIELNIPLGNNIKVKMKIYLKFTNIICKYVYSYFNVIFFVNKKQYIVLVSVHTIRLK